MKFTGHSRSRVFAAAQILVVLMLVFSLPAWARSYHIAKFNSNIHVEEDGSARVEEQITFVFSGEYHGIYRDLPVDYPGPSGSNYTLFIKVDSITDDSGSKLKFEKKTSNGFLHLKIYVPDAVDATRTVNIEYSVANGTRFFEDHDEFYWNVTGNDWPVPIEQASATIYFPAEASGKLRAQAFEGIYGSSQHASASVTGPSASVESNDALPMRGGLTADIYIEKGVLRQPGAIARFFRFVRSNPVLTLPLWAFAVMFPMWWMKGRDPDPGMSVAPMYEPPEKMGPAEVGTLIDGSVDPRDITSVLVDMAVRGYVKIVETQHKGFLSSTKDYEFHLLKDQGDWKGLTDYERAMLQQVFSGGQVTLLSNLTNHFYTALPMIKSEIMAALKAKGMYTVDPNSAAGYLGLGFLLVALPYAALQVMGIADFLSSVPMAIGCGLISVGIILIIGKQLTATSLKGARTQVQIKGFQEFMNRVDADRLKRMPPDTFEKFLPYAMALGVEHRWAKAFEGIIQNPPTWYQGYGPSPSFSTFYFVNSLGSMASTASSTFVSAPRASSSGSGWSGGGGGGGFSGGGFGGGGGGAF
ncbi:hypothetical protein AYO50_01395 [Acidobacteria bacterium SCGC AG-212-P17]|nr:hypothetical protein AYO50_01395 [Acidobacteria bacterium SCGC AG-212-P17]